MQNGSTSQLPTVSSGVRRPMIWICSFAAVWSVVTARPVVPYIATLTTARASDAAASITRAAAGSCLTP
jgi:hypothetical protein